MTDQEIKDLAELMIPFRGLKLSSIGPMKRLVWQWEVNGNHRNHSEIIQNGSEVTPSEARGFLDSAIDEILDKYPDEEFRSR